MRAGQGMWRIQNTILLGHTDKDASIEIYFFLPGIVYPILSKRMQNMSPDGLMKGHFG